MSLPDLLPACSTVPRPTWQSTQGPLVPVRITTRSRWHEGPGTGGPASARATAVRAILAAVDTAYAPHEDAMAWALHPDERVPMALVTGPSKAWVAEDPALMAVLYVRALQDACAEGVLWTPLLDRLAAGSCWPVGTTTVPIAGGWLDVTPGTPQDIAEPLTPWVHAQDTVHALTPLLSCRATAVLSLVAAHAACIDQRLFRHCLYERAGPAGALARNPHLAPEQIRQITELGLVWVDGTHRSSSGRALLAGLLARPVPPGGLVAALVEMAGRAAYVPLDHPLSFPTRAALSLLLGWERLDRDTLRRCYGAVRTRPLWLIHVATHPAATPALWQEILAEQPPSVVRDAIAALPEARTDLTIRQHLAQQGDAAVVRQLVADGPIEDLGGVFRRLAATDPVGALQMLLTASRLPLTDVTLADLHPLMAHGNAQVAAQARALGAVLFPGATPSAIEQQRGNE